MKKLLTITVSLWLFVEICDAQTDILDYLGQTPPGDTPEVFAPGIISIEGRKEKSLTISPEGDEIFFCQAGYPDNSKIYQMIKTDTGWTHPFLAEFIKDDYATEPALSPDGKTLYFSTCRGKSDTYDYNLWRVKKENGEWSEPESLFDIDSSKIYEFHPSVTQDGILYFCWWNPYPIYAGKIYFSKFGSNGYLETIKLGMPVNTQYIDNNHRDVDPYIAPDESYLIIKSNRPGGYGEMDLYISYKKENGGWTNPKNLGPNINTSSGDDVGDISPDGKYMFFTKNDDIYWVDASFIDSLKNTNFAPYIKNPIADTTVYLNEFFSFPIPENTFFDDDQDTLIYTVSERNKDKLPDWLDFDPVTNILFGTPTTNGYNYIEIIATDKDSASVNDIFQITVQLTPIYYRKTNEPSKFQLNQNYPNPFNPLTRILYSLPKSGFVSLKIYNILGQEIQTLVNKFQTAGDYFVTFEANNLSSGVFLYKLKVGNDFIETKKMILMR